MKKFYNSLTSLRGISCLFVILCHDNSGQARGNDSIERSGVMAVDFFFVLSGYLLTRNLMNDEIWPDPTRTEPPKKIFNMTLVKYAIRRYFRVYPAFFVAVWLNYWIYVQYHEVTPYMSQWFEHPFYTLMLTRVFNHLWSIRVEMHFYFIDLPLFGVIASELLTYDLKHYGPNKYRTFIAFLIFPLLFIYFTDPVKIYTVDIWIAWDVFKPHYPVFYYGMLAAVASHFLRTYELKLDTKTKVIVSEVISYLLMLKIATHNDAVVKRYFGVSNEDLWFNHRFMMAPFYAILILWLEKTDLQTSLSRFLNTSALVYMGKWSYSVYLVHWGWMGWVRIHFDCTQIDGAILIVFFCFLIGFIVYTLVENPCYKLNKPAIQLAEKYSDPILEQLGILSQKLKLPQKIAFISEKLNNLYEKAKHIRKKKTYHKMQPEFEIEQSELPDKTETEPEIAISEA